MNPIDKLHSAIDLALSQAPVEEVLAVLTGHLVGLTVELVRRQGHDVTNSITIDGGENRDLTISPPKGIKHPGTRRDVQLGEKLFQFSSKANWINHASNAWRRREVRSSDTVCVDQLGRICTIGLHFNEAERDNAYPIEVYRVRPQVEGGAT